MIELVIGSGRTEISAFVQRIPRLDDRLGFNQTRGMPLCNRTELLPSPTWVLGIYQSENQIENSNYS